MKYSLGSPNEKGAQVSKRITINWNPDELLLAAELVYENGFKGLDDSDPRVRELSSLLRSAGFYAEDMIPDNHRTPASVALKTHNIASKHPDWSRAPTNTGKLDKPALDRFLIDPDLASREARRIRDLILLGETRIAEIYNDVDMSDIQASEGRILRATHIKRERDPKLRQAKIIRTRRLGLPVACEVCAFDFKSTYGERGEGYIEVHHILPLHASGPVASRLDDLALLCSNCHRMIHRKGWLTPLELKEIFERQRPK